MAPFSAIDQTTHAGAVYIAAFYCLVVSSFVASTRLLYRWKHIHLDDVFFGVGYIFSIGWLIAILVGLSNGLSLHGAADYGTASRSVFASQTLLFIALGFYKLSFIFLLRRLSPPSHHRLLLVNTGLMIAVGVGVLLSVIAVRVDCVSFDYLTDPLSTCPDQALRWALVAGFDMLTELSFLAISLILILPLQMPLQKKIYCVLPVALRSVVGLLGVFHAVQITRWQHSGDPEISIDKVLIWESAIMVASAIFATLPIIKNFVKSFDTGFGLQAGLVMSSYGRSNGDTNFEMSPMSNGSKSRPARGTQNIRLDPRQDQYTIDIGNGSAPLERSGSLHSGHSRQIMIRKDIYLDED